MKNFVCCDVLLIQLTYLFGFIKIIYYTNIFNWEQFYLLFDTIIYFLYKITFYIKKPSHKMAQDVTIWRICD